jgi:AraC-like DNA-binding protein
MNHAAPFIAADPDHLIHWLADSVQLDVTVFHLGQYCGRWQASTAGHDLGSFHLVLHGRCYLHIAGREPVVLNARDGVFMIRDIPHILSPDLILDPASGQGAVMQPLATPVLAPDATGLACGFFHLVDPLSALIVDAFPEVLILRADEPALHALGALYDLILLEPPRPPETPSPLVARLAELMFIYVTRHVARRQDIAAGVLAVARRPAFAALLAQVLQAPGEDWSTDRMAQVANMSRSSFYQHFASACGQAPAQFLLLLRMKIAAQRLGTGDTVERTAAHVGYRSYAAFSRAFRKINGMQPGAFRRERLGD